MNALFSYYSLPAVNNDKIYINNAGFIYSWVLSVNLAKKHFNKVILVTDTKGKELLIDELNLPFDEVDYSLDTITGININLFAYPKIFAMDKQTEAFIYIEPDVFLFNTINAIPEVIVQSIEGFGSLDNNYYTTLVNNLSAKGYNNSVFLNREENINYGYNLGIIGGSDLEFIKFFCAQSKLMIEFINNNYTEITTELFKLYEQWLFVLCAKDRNKEITVYLSEKKDSLQFNYTHLMQGKGSSLILYLLKNKLRLLFKDQYLYVHRKLNETGINNLVILN
ncbi:MAG TPA: hypothetical protein PL041_13500 [Melioribacteraceae bacterium]|nr:hypothetical protein [Melioribacteraceae bacterium]